MTSHDDAAARRLDETLAGLPRSLEPGHDLWTAIEAQLEPRESRAGRVWLWAAAAGVLLIVGSSLITATLLQRETNRMVRNLAILGLSLCVLVVIGYGLTHGDWLEGFLAGITLAMATLPEEFPVVLTIFLALGAWRISQKRVLTRRMPAIETRLASVSETLSCPPMTLSHFAAAETRLRNCCMANLPLGVRDTKYRLPSKGSPCLVINCSCSSTEIHLIAVVAGEFDE